VPHQRARDIERLIHPLVQIEGDRIRALQSAKPRTQVVAQHCEPAERAVDVKPQTLRRTEISERIEIVDRARVHRARVSDDAHRRMTRSTIVFDRLRERSRLDRMQRSAPHPHQLERLDQPPVRLTRAVHDLPLRRIQAALAHRMIRARLPSCGEREHVGHRSSQREHAARLGRKSHELGEPSEHALLDERRRLRKARHVWIERGGQHVGHHSERSAVALRPTKEARMSVAVRIREHARDEVFICACFTLRLDRKRFITDRALHLFRHRLPYRAIAQRTQVIDRVVDHAMRERSELFPVLRIERHARSILQSKN
jgi:hypothetical protein